MGREARGASWPKAVLLDLDGTLVDTVPDLHAALNETLASYGEPPFSIEAVTAMVGGGVPVMIERAYAALGKGLDPATRGRIVDRFVKIYEPRAAELSALMPGATGLTLVLSAQGTRLAVVTNKFASAVRSILSHFGLAEAIDVVVGGDAGPPPKPAPDLLLHACRLLGIEARDALFVGDSDNDLNAARAAGMAVVLVRGGYCEGSLDTLGADLVVDRLDEIPELLPRLRQAPRG